MGLNSTTSGRPQKETWKVRTVYNQSQKDILQKWFEHNPYPDTATRRQLAKEIGIPEYNIQIWFKNQRTKRRLLGSGWSLGKDQTQGQEQHQPWIQETLPKEARQDQTSIARSESNIPVQAFDRNQFPDIATRRILAKQTGIQESRIQMKFQNQRSLHPGQSRKPVISLVDGPNETPNLTVQQNQIDLSTVSGWSHHFPSSNSFSKNQTVLPALLPSHVSFVPCVSQGTSVMLVQPMQAVQEENSPSSLALTNYLPIPLTPGGDLSNIHASFWPQNQEKCQNHKEQMGTVLQWKDYSHPHLERRKHQLQDLGQVDLSYIMQWWDECCQALLAEWDPQEGTS